MQQALIRFLRCSKNISARRKRQILFLDKGFAAVSTFCGSTDFFSKQLFAIRRLLVISAAHQQTARRFAYAGE
ncbi:hypothetical protein ACCT03_32100 [Rhizobium johnstonii]|uniref:hypothetical protein n=1 Tax=Rhizobium TaxID=379 RepID=UPI0010306EA4|nr:hypothetical protein [Rhizobium leguminosarum]TBF97711.1 hypothetical protein ELG85_02720 [Rhizobium leguminosarum]TBG66863.1 hypothetical protein ELG74_02825 [Rhizobium leguminosarum]TBH10161.1 hypothetical protein ELG68_02835 [Rhizobium leguminosarum]TBH57390.1 hypothetical protein ELG65_02660 [Rhizobium leguminosarum]